MRLGHFVTATKGRWRSVPLSGLRIAGCLSPCVCGSMHLVYIFCSRTLLWSHIRHIRPCIVLHEDESFISRNATSLVGALPLRRRPRV